LNVEYLLSQKSLAKVGILHPTFATDISLENQHRRFCRKIQDFRDKQGY
jgi:hypothetical protein